MTREDAIKYFKFKRKIECEDYLKICPKNSIAYAATLKEKKFYDMAIEVLEQEPKWISVNERVPKDCKNVLVTIAEHGTTVTYVNFYIPTEERWADDCEVIAWMPLPEPYKGGEERR